MNNLLLPSVLTYILIMICELVEVGSAPSNYWTNIDGCLSGYNDVIYDNINSLEECKQLCMEETSIVCWSVEYGPEGGSHSKKCQLSIEYSATVTVTKPCGSYVLYSERITLVRRKEASAYLRREGQKLGNHILDIRSCSSRLKCTKFCSTYFDCAAYNFNQNNVVDNCELLTQKMDVSAQSDMVEDEKWNYYEITNRIWQ
ncbi:unnamed protein product [Owenia fusiformis]|uniref:Uncharacterized protein n=1 Tax=Owenia fusiformis TaxID=6347 RepID=A0A8J1UVV4_OWEFU|nr:unnamed protein product [Owenia fusiformis]